MTIVITWQRLRGRTCDRCAFLDVFRSNGDGQVTRLHAFCRAPQSAHFNRPVPPERTPPRKARNRFSRALSGMPGPVSSTETATTVPRRSADTVMRFRSAGSVPGEESA